MVVEPEGVKSLCYFTTATSCWQWRGGTILPSVAGIQYLVDIIPRYLFPVAGSTIIIIFFISSESLFERLYIDPSL